MDLVEVRRSGGEEIIGDRINGRPIVYVVSPNRETRSELRALLGRVDCAVRTYASAEGFLSDFKQGESGCLVTESRLTGQDGLDLVRRLKGTDLPAIVLTARGNVRAAVDAMHAGAAACFETPYVRSLLIDEVRKLLGSSAR